MRYINSKAVCSDCGRKILVMLNSIGTPHQSVASVVCAECLKKKGGVDSNWANENKEEAKDLNAWIEEPYDLSVTKG